MQVLRGDWRCATEVELFGEEREHLREESAQCVMVAPVQDDWGVRGQQGQAGGRLWMAEEQLLSEEELEICSEEVVPPAGEQYDLAVEGPTE